MAPALAPLLAAARDGAILQPRPDLGAFAVTGGDRLSWLNGLVTQEVAKLAPGAGAYGLAVGKTGKILAELWLVAAPDRVLVVVERGRMSLVREHFDRHLVMEDAEVGPPLDRGVLFAHGARAPELVAEARRRGGDAAMVDWTGRGDAAVLVAPEGGIEAMTEALLGVCSPATTGGAPVPPVTTGGAPVPPVTRATEAEAEALRVVWGMPRFGVDYDEQSLPQEASLEKVAVSFSKGCYLGQETVFMLEKRGHAKKKLVRLAVEGDAELAAGVEIVLSDGAPVGVVTSATPAPDAAGWLALGSVKYKHTGAGTALSIAGRSARVLAG